MLSVQLMLESSRRQHGGWACRRLLDDATLQAAYCLDAPDEVQDGMEWWQDPEFGDVRGPVPRMVTVREPANVRAEPPPMPTAGTTSERMIPNCLRWCAGRTASCTALSTASRRTR